MPDDDTCDVAAGLLLEHPENIPVRKNEQRINHTTIDIWVFFHNNPPSRFIACHACTSEYARETA